MLWILVDILKFLSFLEFLIGLLCYHKFDRALKFFFLSSVASMLHGIFFRLMKNPVQINIEQNLIMILNGTAYFSYFLFQMKETNRKKILIVFFGVLLLLISVESKLLGFHTYRIWLTEIVLNLFLLIFSVISISKISLKNVTQAKKKVNRLIGMPLVLYLISSIHYDICVGLLWKRPGEEFLYLFNRLAYFASFLLIICTIIAYLCQPKQEPFLQHH